MGKTMKAAVVEKPNVISIKQVAVPEITDNEVLIKVKYTGICGTDWSIYTGKYSADKLPLIAGHEFSGVIAQVWKAARGLKEGDRVTADINMSCGTCYYCRRGQKLMCRRRTTSGSRSLCRDTSIGSKPPRSAPAAGSTSSAKALHSPSPASAPPPPVRLNGTAIVS